MKTQINATYNKNDDAYHIRVRWQECGFQDETVLKYQPTSSKVIFLKDTSDCCRQLNTPIIITHAQLLQLLLTGSYS